MSAAQTWPSIPPASAASLPEGTHLLIEGELTYREYTRTLGSEAGEVNVTWPVTEIFVDTIKALDRKRKDNEEQEGAA